MGGRLLAIALGAVGGALLARAVLSPLMDRGVWVDEGVMGRAYPRTDRALAGLGRRGVRTIVNLHRRPHDRCRLKRHGLSEVHLPIRDFGVPSPERLSRGVDAISRARAAGGVVVHCGGGLGRTGTLLACYLVHEKGIGAEEAIGSVRRLRPGSVETDAQAGAVGAYAREDFEPSRPDG